MNWGRRPPLALLGGMLVPKQARGGQLLFVRSLWERYTRSLITRPLLSRSCSSAVGMMAGELLAQIAQGQDGVDMASCLRLATYAFFLQAPSAYLFYGTMDKMIMPAKPTCTLAVAAKILLDQAIYTPALVCLYYGSLKTLEGRPWEAKSTICEKFMPTVTAGYTFWVPAQVVNFRFVTEDLRIPVLLAFSVAWNAILSTIAVSAQPVHDKPVASLQTAASAGSAIQNFLVDAGVRL